MRASHLLSESTLERQEPPLHSKPLVSVEARLDNIRRYATKLVTELRRGDVVRSKLSPEIFGVVAGFTSSGIVPRAMSEIVESTFLSLVVSIQDGRAGDEEFPETFAFIVEADDSTISLIVRAIFPIACEEYTYVDQTAEVAPLCLVSVLVRMMMFPNLFAGLPPRHILHNLPRVDAVRLVLKHALDHPNFEDELSAAEYDPRIMVEMSAAHDPSMLLKRNSSFTGAYFFHPGDVETVDRPGHTNRVMDEAGRDGRVLDRRVMMITASREESVALSAKGSVRLARDYVPFGRGSLVTPARAKAMLGPQWHLVYASEQESDPQCDGRLGLFTVKPTEITTEPTGPADVTMSLSDVIACTKATDLGLFPGDFMNYSDDNDGGGNDDNISSAQNKNAPWKTRARTRPHRSRFGQKRGRSEAAAEAEMVAESTFLEDLKASMRKDVSPNTTAFYTPLYPKFQATDATQRASVFTRPSRASGDTTLSEPGDNLGEGFDFNSGMMIGIVSGVIKDPKHAVSESEVEAIWEPVFVQEKLKAVLTDIISLLHPPSSQRDVKLASMAKLLACTGQRKGHLVSSHLHLQATRASSLRALSLKGNPPALRRERAMYLAHRNVDVILAPSPTENCLPRSDTGAVAHLDRMHLTGKGTRERYCHYQPKSPLNSVECSCEHHVHHVANDADGCAEMAVKPHDASGANRRSGLSAADPLNVANMTYRSLSYLEGPSHHATSASPSNEKAQQVSDDASRRLCELHLLVNMLQGCTSVVSDEWVADVDSTMCTLVAESAHSIDACILRALEPSSQGRGGLEGHNLIQVVVETLSAAIEDTHRARLEVSLESAQGCGVDFHTHRERFASFMGVSMGDESAIPHAPLRAKAPSAQSSPAEQSPQKTAVSVSAPSFSDRVANNILKRKARFDERHLWATELNVNGDLLVTGENAPLISRQCHQKTSMMLVNEYERCHGNLTDEMSSLAAEPLLGFLESKVENDLLRPSRVNAEVAERLHPCATTVPFTVQDTRTAGGILALSLPQQFLENALIAAFSKNHPDLYTALTDLLSGLFGSLFVPKSANGSLSAVEHAIRSRLNGAEVTCNPSPLPTESSANVTVRGSLTKLFSILAGSHFWRIALDAMVDVALLYTDSDEMNRITRSFSVITSPDAFAQNSCGLLMSASSMLHLQRHVSISRGKPGEEGFSTLFPIFEFLTGSEVEYTTMLYRYGVDMHLLASKAEASGSVWYPFIIATQAVGNNLLPSVDKGSWCHSAPLDWRLNAAGCLRRDAAIASLSRTMALRGFSLAPSQYLPMLSGIVPVADVVSVLPSKMAARVQIDPYKFGSESITLNVNDIVCVSDFDFGPTVGTTVLDGSEMCAKNDMSLAAGRQAALTSILYPTAAAKAFGVGPCDDEEDVSHGILKWFEEWKRSRPHYNDVIKSYTVVDVAFEDGYVGFGIPATMLLDKNEEFTPEGPTIDELANPAERANANVAEAEEGTDQDGNGTHSGSSTDGSGDEPETDSPPDLLRDFENPILPSSIVQPSLDYAKVGVAAAIRACLGSTVLPVGLEGTELRRAVRQAMRETTEAISRLSLPIWTLCLTDDQLAHQQNEHSSSTLDYLAQRADASMTHRPMPLPTHASALVQKDDPPLHQRVGLVNDWQCPLFAIRLLDGTTPELEVGSVVRISHGPKELHERRLFDKVSHRHENGNGAGGGAKSTEFYCPWWGENVEAGEVPCYLGVARSVHPKDMVAAVTWFEQFSERAALISRRAVQILMSPVYKSLRKRAEVRSAMGDDPVRWAEVMAECSTGKVVGLLANTMVRVRWADGLIEDVSRVDVCPILDAVPDVGGGAANEELEIEEDGEEENEADESSAVCEERSDGERAGSGEPQGDLSHTPVATGPLRASVATSSSVGMENDRQPVGPQEAAPSSCNANDIPFSVSDRCSFLTCSLLGSSILERLPQFTSTPSRSVLRRMRREWEGLREYCLSLNATADSMGGAATTSAVHVRVCPDSPCVIKFALMGPIHTPYYQSLICFDVALPAMYPTEPPLCLVYSYGLRLNPNLYANGHICLSLLGTWEGEHATERWQPASSLVLHIVQSIQALVLVKEPYYNEAGHDSFRGDPKAAQYSRQYNEDTALTRIRHLMAAAENPPADWLREVQAHYMHVVPRIMQRLQAIVDNSISPREETKVGAPSSSNSGSVTPDGIVLPATLGFLNALKYHLALLRQQYARLTTQWRAQDAKLLTQRRR